MRARVRCSLVGLAGWAVVFWACGDSAPMEPGRDAAVFDDAGELDTGPHQGPVPAFWADWKRAAATDDFCATLVGLFSGRVSVPRSDNDFVGHTAALQRLLDHAPVEVAEDLTRLRDVFAEVRDMSGASAALHFRDLVDPELAAVEGRIADFVEAHCGIRYGDPSYGVDVTPATGQQCPAWNGVGSPRTNNRFPYLLDTAGSNYARAMFVVSRDGSALPGFIPVPPGGSVVVRGHFPHARYFGFHPNDVETNNLEPIRDEDIQPDPGGVNPFREEAPAGTHPTYTVRFTWDETQASEPNTRYVGTTARGDPNNMLFLIYRIYGTDDPDGPDLGGVPLPSVTVYDASGTQVARYEECDPYSQGSPMQDRTRFPTFPVADVRSWDPPRFTRAWQWGLDVDIMTNADVLYLRAFYSLRHGPLLVVRGKALSTPDTRAGEPPYAPGKDARVWTVCTYNFWAGRANTCLLDHEVVRDEEGYYTIVVSQAADRPENATEDQGVTWMDWGPYLDGVVVLRTVFVDDERVAALGEAVGQDEPPPEVAPYVPRAWPCDRKLFEEAGWRGCAERYVPPELE